MLALTAAGCSGGAGVARKAVAAVGRKHDGPVGRLAVARSTWLQGEPGGMAADEDGVVTEVDDRTVVAHDTQGHQRWSASVPGAALGWPWLGHRLVVVPTSSAGDLDSELSGADDSGGCVAVDRATGTRRWSYEEEGGSGVAVASLGDRAFCVSSQGVISAVDLRTGRLLWRVVLFTSFPRSAVSVSERTAIAVDPATGTLIFTAQLSSHWVLVVRDAATGADRGTLDMHDGGPSSAPASIGPGRVAIATADPGEVCKIDVRRRRVDDDCIAVKAPSGFDPASVPVVAGGMLVIAARDGSVTAIDITKWRLRWTKELPTPMLDGRPAVSGDVVLLADWTRAPWALRMADGSEIAPPDAQGFVIATATGPGGGFAVAVRGDPDGRIERWLPRGQEQAQTRRSGPREAFPGRWRA